MWYEYFAALFLPRSSYDGQGYQVGGEGGGHTGLWTLGRWHFSHKFRTFQNGVKVIMFDGYKHLG